MPNKGIIQTGGIINANNIVAGDNASVQSGGRQQLNASLSNREEATKLLDQVITKLKLANAPELPKEEIVSSIQTIKTELSKEKPNNLTIQAISTGVLDNLRLINDQDIAPLFQRAFEKIYQ